jgi:hypothetical protein
MKPFTRVLAGVAIVWAFVMPGVLFVQELRDGQAMKLEVMAQNLHSALPKQPASDTATVTLPASGVSNWAGVMRDLAVTEDRRLDTFAVTTLVSSVAIIILSVSILRVSKRDENTVA